MYPIHRYLGSNFQDLPVLLGQHTLLLFLCDTKQEYDVPTKVDEKYTNHEYSPSSVNMFFQNDLGQSLLFHRFVAIQSPHRQVAAFSQTIVSINTVQQPHRYVQNVQQSEDGLQF